MQNLAKTSGPNRQGNWASHGQVMVAEPGHGIDPIEILRIFWRRKILFLGVTFAIALTSVAIAYLITPRYSASTQLMIDPVQGRLTGDSGAISQSLLTARSSIYGEIEVMTSDRLIEKVVAELRLVEDPEFNESRRDGIAQYLSIDALMSLIGATPQDAQIGSDLHNSSLIRVIERIRNRLRIQPPRLSNVVSIEFESSDAKKAASIANVLAGTYIADHLDRKFRANLQAQEWLQKRLEELRRNVLASERAIADFQVKRTTSDSSDSAFAEQQLSEMLRQLMAAKTNHTEKQLRLDQVKKLARSPDGIESVKEVRDSHIIQRLRDQESTLTRKSAELEGRFGERHPEMIKFRAELENLRGRIQEEQQRIVQELENEVRVAAARESSLKQDIDELQESRGKYAREDIQLRQLNREAEANRRLYESFLARSKQTNQQEALYRSDVEVISTAKVPLDPSYPRKPMIIGFGTLFAIAVGLFVAFLAEKLDKGFRTVTQLERVTNLQSLGVVPKLAHGQRRMRELVDLMFKNPDDPYVEAVRSLRTSLLVSNVNNPPKVVLIASSQPNEGKSGLAISLARLSSFSALQGRVILIDCDLRRPSIGDALGMAARKGLIDLFAGEASLDELIQIDPKTGLHVIPSTIGTPNPPELLNSHHMRALLDKLSKGYDTIILDSPALNAVSDARVLAHLADATVFVVEWEATPRHMALECLGQLISAGANIAGVVLQKVNLRKSTKYGYEDAAA